MRLLPFYEGPSPEMAAGSAYCLKWNNHRTNLLSAFSVLLQQEAFTDVTLACEDGETLHAHRLVLAACSSYFASLFSSAHTIHTDKHPIVILRDIKASDMKAILEYMYRGEVNIERDALPNLLRVADGLRIKGLIGELSSSNAPLPLVNHSNYEESRGIRCPTPKDEDVHNSAGRERRDYKMCSSPHTESPEKRKSVGNCNGSRSESPPPSSPVIQSPPRQYLPLPLNSYFSPNFLNIMERREFVESPRDRPDILSRPPSVDYKFPNHIPLLASLTPQPLNGLESPPPKRSRNLMREPILPHTPILRTALAHTHGIRHDVLASLASSILPIQSQINAMIPARIPTSPIPSTNNDPSEHVRRESDYHDQMELDTHQFASQNLPFGLTHPKKEEPLSDDDSKSFSDGSKDSGEKEKVSRPMVPDFSNYNVDHNSAHFSNFASYVPNSRPEWKRYKQYTKRDLENAIEAVKSGMTALQASREHKVPSRTLYDKIKKMGINTVPRRLPKRTSQMDVDSTSDTPIAHVDVRTPSSDLFDQRPLSRSNLDNRPPPAVDIDNGTSYYSYPASRTVAEDEFARKGILDHAENGGTTRGSFSVVERKVLPDGNSLPLDLTDHSSIIPGRQQIEERA